MIKSELIERIAVRNPHLFQRDVEHIVNAILEEIVAALSRGDRVELRGFGAFSVKNRPARTGRNPRTGEQVTVSEKYVPFFKTGKDMRERLNGGGRLTLLGHARHAPEVDHPAAGASSRSLLLAVANDQSVTVHLNPFDTDDPVLRVDLRALSGRLRRLRAGRAGRRHRRLERPAASASRRCARRAGRGAVWQPRAERSAAGSAEPTCACARPAAFLPRPERG